VQVYQRVYRGSLQGTSSARTLRFPQVRLQLWISKARKHPRIQNRGSSRSNANLRGEGQSIASYRDMSPGPSRLIIARVTATRRRSRREAMLALNPSSQHHRSRPAVTNRGVSSNRSHSAPRRNEEETTRRYKTEEDVEKDDEARRGATKCREEGNRPDNQHFFP